MRTSINSQFTALSSDSIQMLITILCTHFCEFTRFWGDKQVLERADHRWFTRVTRNVSLTLVNNSVGVSIHNTRGIWTELILISSYALKIIWLLFWKFEPAILIFTLMIFCREACLLVEFVFVKFDVIFRNHWDFIRSACCFSFSLFRLRFDIFTHVSWAFSINAVDTFDVFVASSISYIR